MPKKTIEIPLSKDDHDDFAILAIKACEVMNWSITRAIGNLIEAESEMSLTQNTWGEIITITWDESGASIMSKSKGNTLFDFGRNQKNLNKFLNEYEELKKLLTSEEVGELRKQHLDKYPKAGESDTIHQAEGADGKNGWWALLVPRKGYFFTPLLIWVNVLLFLFMTISSGDFSTLLSPSPKILMSWGANYGPLTHDGQPWRLITCMFEHIGIVHLLFNMYALLYIGILLEPILGKTRYITGYFCTGIAASLTSLWWNDSVVSAGASGAIFGMYGIFLALLMTNLIEKETRKQMFKSMVIFIGYNLIFGLKAGVDNAAHIGGLLSGIFGGFIYYVSLKNEARKQYSIALALLPALLTILIGLFAFSRMGNATGEYIKVMNQYQKYESEALDVYSHSDSLPEYKYVLRLLEQGIPNWHRCLSELNKLDKLNLNKNLAERTEVLLKYTQLRLQEAELIKDAVSEHTNKYDSAIIETGEQIKETMGSLSGK